MCTLRFGFSYHLLTFSITSFLLISVFIGLLMAFKKYDSEGSFALIILDYNSSKIQFNLVLSIFVSSFKFTKNVLSLVIFGMKRNKYINICFSLDVLICV